MKSTLASGLAIAGDMGLAIGRPDTTRAPPWIGGIFASQPSDYLQWIHRGQDSFWNGGLDEIRIWNRSLTDAEISKGFKSSCATSDGPPTNPTVPLVCFGFEDVWEGSIAAGFRDTGAAGGAKMVPVVGDRHTTWCETRDDQGQLMSQYSLGSRAANKNGQSWGFCTDKPQVPGLGFDYSESALFQFRMSNVSILPQLPGCGDVPVIFSSNSAVK
jgi:hypothetical protein